MRPCACVNRVRAWALTGQSWREDLSEILSSRTSEIEAANAGEAERVDEKEHLPYEGASVFLCVVV